MAMGELRKGKDLIKKSAESGSRKTQTTYTPFISWKPNEVKSLFFITPLDEVPEVMMHEFVRKYDTATGKERWLTFMCRKDAAWKNESGNKCPLCDEIGHKPVKRYVSVAVEVEPVYDGKRLQKVNVKYNAGVDKEGNDVEYPAVGYVMKGPKFFNTLAAHDQKRDISELSWEITREGDGLTTQYIFYPLDEMPDTTELLDALPDLGKFLEYLGSEEKYESELQGVTMEDQPSYDKTSNRKSTKSDADRGSSFEDLKRQLDSKVGSYS